MRIGEKIRKLRKERGLSQQQLGDIVDAAASAISDWERGIKHPKGGSMKKLCKAFNITLEEFAEGVDLCDLWR